jgi:hypothetical protein
LSEELCLIQEQARYAVAQLKKRLGAALRTKVKRANNILQNHYYFDEQRLIETILPGVPEKKPATTSNIRHDVNLGKNRSRKSPMSKIGRFPCQMKREIFQTINRSEPLFRTICSKQAKKNQRLRFRFEEDGGFL